MPLYLIWILAFFSVFALLVRGFLPAPPGWVFEWLFADPLPLWFYLTFTHNLVAVCEARLGSVTLAPIWSLAVEEQFVLILPLLVAFVRERWLHYVLLVPFLAAPIFRAWLQASLESPDIPMAVLLPTRGDALFLGVLCAWLVRVPERLKPLQGRGRGIYAVLSLLAGAVVWARVYPLWDPSGRLSPTLLNTLLALLFACLLLVAVTEKRGSSLIWYA